VRKKVGATREVVLADAAGRLDAIEAAIEGGRGGQARAEISRLASMLKGTELADRASAIEAKSKSATEDSKQ